MACQRREIHVSMSIFMMILDLACSNGYAVACALLTAYKASVSYGEFKCHVADQLTLPWSLRKNEVSSTQMEPNESTLCDNEVTSGLHFHILCDNKKRKSTIDGVAYHKDGPYFLCTVLGLHKTKSDTISAKTGCFECGHCFHLHYFNLVHYQHLNSVDFNNEMNFTINAVHWHRKRKKGDIGQPC